MSLLVVAQIIGVIAMALDLLSAAQKDDRKMVLLSAAGCSTFALHYFLLGAYSGVAAELLNASRNVISQKWKYKAIGFIFAGINAAMILTVDNVISALPYCAGIIISLSLYNFDGVKLRIGYVAGFSLWLIYAAINHSIGGTLMFVTAIILYSTNIYRLRKEMMP